MPDRLASHEAWRANRCDKLNRPEAIRRLVVRGLDV